MKRLRIVNKPDDSPKELRTSTVLDREIIRLIQVSMMEKGYGQRQRSKWINEAIQHLKVELDGCEPSEKAETLSRAAILSDNGDHITVVLKPESVSFVENCKEFMTSFEKEFDVNAQSRLIHFAITFRLIREKYV
jgi:hypothetical protein